MLTEKDIAEAYQSMKNALTKPKGHGRFHGLYAPSDEAIATLTIGMLQLNQLDGQLVMIKDAIPPATKPVPLPARDYGDLTPPGGGRMV